MQVSTPDRWCRRVGIVLVVGGAGTLAFGCGLVWLYGGDVPITDPAEPGSGSSDVVSVIGALLSALGTLATGAGTLIVALSGRARRSAQPTPAATSMAWRFNPPPGWPPPPADWSPPVGWQPDPSWPPAPVGWQFWIPVRD